MTEVVCGSKSFTINVAVTALAYEWSIVTPSPLAITEGENAEVTVRYHNMDNFEHEVCFMLMDGTTVLDASPEGCRDCKCGEDPSLLYIGTNPIECGGKDMGQGETKEYTLYGKNLTVGTHNLIVRIRTRKSVI